jgi:hypothetical protein
MARQPLSAGNKSAFETALREWVRAPNKSRTTCGLLPQ